MFFNSVSYLFFLPLVVILYYLLPLRFRWSLLLIAGSVFYISFIPAYIFVLFAIIIFDYIAAILLEKIQSVSKKQLLLAISLLFNISVLVFFKYFIFLNEFLTRILHHYGHQNPLIFVQLIFPLGISFQIFQSAGYLLDVYYEKHKAERHLGIYSLFIMFFPLMIAGPIERFSSFGFQLREKISLHYDNIANGGRLILCGFFIKMAIADNLSVYVNQVYDAPETFNSLSILISVFLYSFQIYADFYGYSLIAIGSALLLGFKLMDNFNTPYFARSIMDFWGRWHISLTSWLRDYLYNPLSLRLRYWGIAGVVLAVIITFFISGIWHGVGWTFLIWGLLHGLFLLIETGFNKFFKIKPKKNWTVGRVLNICKTFILVSFLWIFFRSENFEKARLVFKSIAANFSLKDKFHINEMVLVLFAIFIFLDMILFNKRFDIWISKQPIWLRWITYALLLFAILTLSGVDNTPFIYARF